jgi:adenylate cyclase
VHGASEGTSFGSELKRRHVVRVAITYVVAEFVVIKAADVLLPALNLAEWTVTPVVALTFLGFPIALGLAWAFDITPSGVVRSGPTSQSATTAESSAPGEDVPTAGLPVSTAQGAQSAVAAASGPEGGVQASPSIAVLPFDDMNPDGDHEYFGDGIAEELINALTQLKGLRVAASRV